MMLLLRSLPFLRKKLTVMGIIGHTHGVKRATRPPRKQVKKMYQSDVVEKSSALSDSANDTGAQRSAVFPAGTDDASESATAARVSAGAASSARAFSAVSTQY